MMPEHPPATGRPLESNPLRWRYAEGYRLSRLLAKVASIARIAVAAIVAVGIVAGLAQGLRGWMIGLVPTALFALSAWIATLLLDAASQILLALIDTSVNTSPLLSDGQKTEIMGVRRSSA